MRELTVTIFEKEGELYGIGETGKPTSKHISNSCNQWSFVRGDTRIHVMAVTQSVTVAEARIFAIFMYEGRCEKVNIQEVFDYGFAALS